MTVEGHSIQAWDTPRKYTKMKDLLNYLRKVFFTPLLRITNYFETHTYQKVFSLPYVYLNKEQKYDHDDMLQ